MQWWLLLYWENFPSPLPVSTTVAFFGSLALNSGDFSLVPHGVPSLVPPQLGLACFEGGPGPSALRATRIPLPDPHSLNTPVETMIFKSRGNNDLDNGCSPRKRLDFDNRFHYQIPLSCPERLLDFDNRIQYQNSYYYIFYHRWMVLELIIIVSCS